MNKTVRREISALHRIGVRCREITRTGDIIPFVWAGHYVSDGSRVVYLDVLEWYAAKSDQPGLLLENRLYPDVWDELKLRATFRPGYPRSVWKRVYRDFRCILGERGWCGSGGFRRELLGKAHRLVKSELLAEAAV
ncbi:TPA: hypothetical protein I8Y21_006018 [Klebsiella oxytoca]|uniref:Uncharacterized protein n=1 Tax=Klebsiella oxytoca TaxID=571 RepID=A0AAN5LE90_KLEOX|nr:hypothetical protein [Klebsiella oxytoca]